MESGTTTPGIIGNKANSNELKTLIGKLRWGRAIADELKSMVHDKSNGGGAAADDALLSILSQAGGDMVENIITSFTDALSIIEAANHHQHHHDSGEVISQLNNKRPQQQEYSGESCKTPVPKDRRGTYKRRKTADTWTRETPSSFEDGHAWRKYGQKTILNTKHPRSYFRCTHKYDQKCQATKQVQRIQEDPSMYRTTYHGNHTCKKFTQSLPHDDQQHLMDDDHHSSIIWSFQSSAAPAIPQVDDTSTVAVCNKTTNCAAQLMKQEEHADISSSSELQHSYSKVVNQDDYFVSPNFDHLGPFDTSVRHLNAFSSGSDHADVISSSDVYSCTTSTVHGDDGIDMDSMLNFSDFSDDHFHYNELR